MDLEQFSGESFEIFQEAELGVGKHGAACCPACAAAEREDETGATSSAPNAALARGARVLLVGDSHTHGAFGQELERLLSQRGLSVLRRAKIGSAVKFWLPRLPALLREHRPDVVIVALGANMRGYPSARGVALQIKKTVQLIRGAQPGARLVWVGPPRRRGDTDADLERFNRVIERALAGQATFIDSGSLTPRYVGRDGVHYASAEGKAWARGALAALSSGLQKELEDETFEDEALGEALSELEGEALGAYEDLEDEAVGEAFDEFEDEGARSDEDEEEDEDEDEDEEEDDGKGGTTSNDVQAFAERLGAEWSRRRGGTPSAEAMKQWLLKDHADTLAGARKRWRKDYGKGRFSFASIARAWMVSREHHLRFQQGSSSVKPLGRLAPPATPVQLVSSPLIDGSKMAPVAPIMVQFTKQLKQRHPGVRAMNYRGHGGGSFNGRGYSLDLFLKGLDERGFYRRDEAVRMLRAVHEAAIAVGAEWRVIYNDFDVADSVNRALGRQHVVFVGSTRKSGGAVSGLNWHGPDPLILHFHLDLSPANGPSPSRWRSASTGASSQEAAPTPSLTSSTGSGAAAGVGKIESALVRRIDRYADVIDSAARQAGVSPHVLRGIIAAESDGNADAGAGGTGYKGLMQCQRTADQLTPETSIQCGAKKYLVFTRSMQQFMKKLGLSFDALPEDARVRIVAASYNAGPGTVQRAMRFAAAAGDVNRWLEQEHYLRALLSTGAYATGKGQLGWCLRTGRLSVSDLASDLARVSGKSLEELRPRYAPTGTWDKRLLLERLPVWLRVEDKKLRNKGELTLDQARARASKSLLCVATFKQAHSQGYIDKIVRYRRYFAAR